MECQHQILVFLSVQVKQGFPDELEDLWDSLDLLRIHFELLIWLELVLEFGGQHQNYFLV